MADPPPLAGSGAVHGGSGGPPLSEDAGQEALEAGVFKVGGSPSARVHATGEEEIESDGSLDAAVEFAKDLEEQRRADEKNGHFVSDRVLAQFREVLAASKAESLPPAASPVENVSPSRVSLASHKKKVLDKIARSPGETSDFFAAVREKNQSGPGLLSSPSSVSLPASHVAELDPLAGVSVASLRQKYLESHALVSDICMFEGEGSNEGLHAGVAAASADEGTPVSHSLDSDEVLGLDGMVTGECERAASPKAEIMGTISKKSGESMAKSALVVEPSTFGCVGNETKHGSISLSQTKDTFLHGNLEGGAVFSAETHTSHLDDNILLIQEANSIFDMMENRPLAAHDVADMDRIGPPFLGLAASDLGPNSLCSGPLFSPSPPPAPGLQAQVCPPLPCSQPSAAQPNSPIPLQHLTKLPSPPSAMKKQKAYIKKKPSVTFKSKPTAQSKPPTTLQKKASPSAQPNNPAPNSKPFSNFKPNLNSKEKDLLNSLFVVGKNVKNSDLGLGEKPPISRPICDEDMVEFPPLNPSQNGVVAPVSTAPPSHASSSGPMHSLNEDDGAAGSPTVEPSSSAASTPTCNPAAMASAPASSWAARVSFNAKNLVNSGTAAPPHSHHAATPDPPAQPNVQFDHSMADAVRSGQPSEGHFFLDQEKAEKRGEVRIVEGKPCLFFSANETALLADRLGPSIVGKFSHSIPTAHQIQKALGKIKLVGEMSWNFLNAKHVFIKLSDMRDYVKILNGPNNAPVWYIDHHPMRVFKWTPNFDPFFETPIVTLWCNIIALPVHLFEESALIAIGGLLGKPVQVDRATIARTRVSFARICVEVDLSRPILEEIDIDIAGKRVTLKVKWEKIPLYCTECKHVGHAAATCYASGKRPMPAKKDYSHGPPMQNRPPYNRNGGPWRSEEQHLGSRQHHGRPSAGESSQGPRFQPRFQRSSAKPAFEVRQGYRTDGRPFEEEHSAPAVGPSSGPSSAPDAAQAAHADGFVGVRKKKGKGKSKGKAKQQGSAPQREGIFEHGSSSKYSREVWDVSKIFADAPPSEVRRARSLSPSNRADLESEVGPLAMVLHGENMFGALEDEASDEFDADSDDLLDDMAVEVPPWPLLSKDPVMEYIGHPSPPPEGSSKKARHSASSSTPPPSHV